VFPGHGRQWGSPRAPNLDVLDPHQLAVILQFYVAGAWEALLNEAIAHNGGGEIRGFLIDECVHE